MIDKLLIVIPAFNEEQSVSGVIESVRAMGHEAVVVDDGSSDSTAAVASAAGATVLRLPMNLGVGAALRCGFRYAVDCGYTAVIQCDADGQHLPDFIPALLLAAEESGAHLVIGSRFVVGDLSPTPPIARRTAMRILAALASRATGGRLTDVTSGFRLIRGELLRNFSREFPAYYLGDTFEAAYVAGRVGYRVIEIPVKMQQRLHGTSTASNGDAIRQIAKAVLTTSLRVHFGLASPTNSPDQPQSRR